MDLDSVAPSQNAVFPSVVALFFYGFSIVAIRRIPTQRLVITICSVDCLLLLVFFQLSLELQDDVRSLTIALDSLPEGVFGFYAQSTELLGQFCVFEDAMNLHLANPTNLAQL